MSLPLSRIQLQPMPHEIGIFGPLLAEVTEELIIREKVMSLSGDSFDIKRFDGQPQLQVKGSVMSFSGRKKVCDANGVHLFDICKEHLHIHKTFAILDPNGAKLMEVKSGFALIGSKAKATFTTPSTGKAESLSMKGNWLDNKADIVDDSTGLIVAVINRERLNKGDLLFGQQTYGLVVAPGVDKALMAAMCICLDEAKNENKGGLLS